MILRLCGYVVLQSRLRWTTKSPPRWGSREGANWGAVVRIAAASAVTLTRPATRGADDGSMRWSVGPAEVVAHDRQLRVAVDNQLGHCVTVRAGEHGGHGVSVP